MLGKVIFFIQAEEAELRNLAVSRCRMADIISQTRDDSTPTGKGNGLNLNGHALGQLLDSHAGTGRLVSEVLLVDRVHLGEVVHSSNKNIDL